MPELIQTRDGLLHVIGQILKVKACTSATVTHFIGACDAELWASRPAFEVPEHNVGRHMERDNACPGCRATRQPAILESTGAEFALPEEA